MPTTNPDPNHLITYTYTRPNFSPFYIISIVLSSIILLAILLLLGRASYRQRVLRRRWTRLLMFGNVRVDWRVREQEERVVNTKAPVLREISISWRDSVEFDKSHPVAMALPPTPPYEAHAQILHLLSTPAYFTRNLFTRLRTIGALRHPKRSRQRQTRRRPAVQDVELTNLEDPKPAKVKKVPPSEVGGKPADAQALFLIAMPTPPSMKSPVSPTRTNAGEELAAREFALGAVEVLWTRSPELYPTSSITEEREEEDEGEDFASVGQARQPMRRQRAWGRSPGTFARVEDEGSVVSSRYLDSYLQEDASGLQGSSYRGQGSTHEGQGSAYEGRRASYEGSTNEGRTQASTYETLNSFLAPPGNGRTDSSMGRPYTPSTRSIPVTTQRVRQSEQRLMQGSGSGLNPEVETHVGSAESRPTILDLPLGSLESRPWSGEGIGSRVEEFGCELDSGGGETLRPRRY